MAQHYYEDLGLKPGATRDEIKSAYRQLVLLHHPDRSKDQGSKAIFLRITEAYEVLSDSEAKRRYDEQLELAAKRARDEAEKKAARLKEEKKATPSGATVAEEIVRLQTLFGSGRHSEAEKLGYAILQVDPRQAIPYAVLADILRARGYVNEAGKMYAYAVQMDPKNPVYQRRYEQLLRSSQIVSKHGNFQMEAEDKQTLAPMVGGGFVLAGGLAVAFVPSHPVMKTVSLVSTWSIGLMVVLFISGIAVGASLAVGNHLGRFSMVASSAGGRTSPTAILGIVAIVNFWVSALLYVMIAIGLRAFNVSTTRLMMGVGAATLLLTAACLPSNIIPSQTFLWGGNLVYIGGLVGWMTVDALRPEA